MKRPPFGQLARSALAAAALWAAFLLAAPVFIAGPGPAIATVPTSSNSITVAGNGVQTSFSFPFVGVAAADIQVLFTTASGNQTTLAQGPGPTQYQVTLNAAVAPALWGVGGTVTYNPSGTPIPSGSSLTITRTLPVRQDTTLQNQASFGQYAQVTEQAIDLQNMQLQQVAGTIGRTIVANPANSSAPAPLPPAAQVAGQGVCFDGSGNNLIGCVLPSSGVISSAMAPVVSAVSLAAGRTAFGLGTMALENINGGSCGGATLQDDGSGNARVVFATVADSSNQAVTCAFHGQQHLATGALVYTLPRANTLFNGFGFWIYPLTNSVTFAVNAADGFSGAASGASMTIPAGSIAYVSTNAQTSGTWFLQLTNLPSFSAPVNLNLSCATAGNALTCAVKDRNGNDPSTASPVIYPASLGGNLVPRAITGALSITVPSSATVGTVNGQANRLWVAVFDNAGTPVLGVYNSFNASALSIKAWDETSAANGTAIAGGSNSAQTWYTSTGVTGVAVRVLGYVESTQPTAGTWSAAVSKVQLFGQGIKRPGETVQKTVTVISVASNLTTATFTPFASHNVAITPQSAANLIGVRVVGSYLSQAGGDSEVTLSRGTVANTNLFGSRSGFSTGGVAATPMTIEGYDTPNTTGATTYAVQGRSRLGSITITFGAINNISPEGAQYTLEEIQI